MGIQQSKQHEIVTLSAALQESSSVGQVDSNLRRIIGMFGMFPLAESQDRRVNVHRIHKRAVVAQSSGHVVAGSRPDHQHGGRGRDKTERQIVWVFVGPLPRGTRDETGQEIVRKVDNGLVAGVIHPQLAFKEFAVVVIGT